MTRTKFKHTKPHANIGIVGHVDRGKMTLTVAIIRVLHDKYPGLNEYTPFDRVSNTPEEHNRSATINVSRVEYQTDKRHYVHVNAPGYVDYVKNMITGTAQMDGTILVVTTVDDPVAQTHERILLARQVGVPTILIALNEVDMVDGEEMLELAEEKCRDLLESQDFDHDAPVIQASALKALEGDPEWVVKAEELIDAVDPYIPIPERGTGKPFLAPTEDVLTITGHSTVVAGRAGRSKLLINSEVGILGIHEPQKTAVTGTEMFHEPMGETRVSEDCDLLLRGTERDRVGCSQVVAVPGSVTPHTDFESRVYVLKREGDDRHDPFFSNYRP